MIKAIVKICDAETDQVICDGIEVLPHIESYKLRHGEKIRKSKFAFEYVMELEAADENI